MKKAIPVGVVAMLVAGPVKAEFGSNADRGYGGAGHGFANDSGSTLDHWGILDHLGAALFGRLPGGGPESSDVRSPRSYSPNDNNTNGMGGVGSVGNNPADNGR